MRNMYSRKRNLLFKSNKIHSAAEWISQALKGPEKPKSVYCVIVLSLRENFYSVNLVSI